MAMYPFQRDCLRASLIDYRAMIRRQLWVLPTSAGKTVVSSRIPELIKQQPGEQGMFFVNRDDLVWQGADTLRALNPKLKVDIEKADYHADLNADIIVCSLASVARGDGVSPRFARFDERRVRWAVVDECHGILSKPYLHVLRHLRMYKAEKDADPLKLLVGITATPDRSDGVGLEQVFDKISYEIPIRQLTETGATIGGKLYSYLASPRGFRVTTDFDVSMVRTKKGEFVDQDLSAALDNPERNKLILDRYLEYGEGMPAIGFTVDVQHAHNLAEMFTRNGVPAMPISGSTTTDQRRRIYDAYRAGDCRALFSCQALCEGFDMPIATVALMVTPYKSSLRYRQCVGRVLRRSPSVARMMEGGYDGWVKPYAIILDFCDLLGKHSIQCIPSLFGLKSDFDLDGKDALEAAKEVEQIKLKYPGIGDVRSIKELHAQVDSVDIFRAPVVRPDVRKASKFSWLEILDGVLQLNTRACTLEVRVNVLGLFEVYQSISGIRHLKETRPTLKEALAVADAMVPREEHAIHRTKAIWREEPPSHAQCRRLWQEDDRIRKRFKESIDFFNFACQQHEAGNTEFSKGSMSRQIDRWVLSRAAAS
jgi:superfamily II DNA or RNA helicase